MCDSKRFSLKSVYLIATFFKTGLPYETSALRQPQWFHKRLDSLASIIWFVAEVHPGERRKRFFLTARRRKRHHGRLWLAGSGGFPAQGSSNLLAISKRSHDLFLIELNYSPAPRQFSPTGSPSSSKVGSIWTTQLILAEGDESAKLTQVLFVQCFQTYSPYGCLWYCPA
jgi:hypothetical protein